jgi:hypothetical protein
MFGKEKVHGDVTIRSSSSLPSSDISVYLCGFCFCLDLSMLLNFWIWSCMLDGVIGHPSLRCWHHCLLFLILIISLLFLFHRFPLCSEQNIYRNIVLLKSLLNYLSNVWSFIKNGVQTRELFAPKFCTRPIRLTPPVRLCPTTVWPVGRLVADPAMATPIRLVYLESE